LGWQVALLPEERLLLRHTTGVVDSFFIHALAHTTGRDDIEIQPSRL